VAADDEPFLRAIRENPHDDGPCLVYADWLEEQGDPRGEFTRAQCRLAHLDPLAPEYRTLSKRSRALLNRFGDTWMATLPKQYRRVKSFYRGFPVLRVNLSCEQFLRRTPRSFRHSPLWGAELRPIGPLYLSLAASPNLRFLGFLNVTYAFSGSAVGDGDLLAVALAASPHAVNLEGLHLGGNGVMARGVAALASSERLRHLKQLQFTPSPLGSAGVRALTQGRPIFTLSRLSLSQCGLDDAAAEALAAWPGLASVTCLDLAFNAIGDAGARALARSPYVGRLTELWLSDNHVGDAGARALVNSTALDRLTHLSLGQTNRVSAEGLAALQRRTGLPRLEHLHLPIPYRPGDENNPQRMR
jgi:uncharacterized protein (TIGR02996 family)